MAITESNLNNLNDTTAVMVTEKAIGQLIYNTQEYSNNITSSAIGALNVTATSASNNTTAYYLSQISQTDGKITATAVAVEQSYNSSGVKPISGKGVQKALESLDVDPTSASNTTTAYYISQISETDGKIAATAVAVEQTYSSTGVKPVSGKSIAAAIASLNSSISATTAGYVIKGITITNGEIVVNEDNNFLNLNPSLSSTNATENNAQKLNISVGGVTSSNVELNKATTTTYGVIKKHSATSATLSFATSATSATISVTGVTTSNTVIVSPLANDAITVGTDTLSSWEIWRDAGIRCSSQANNQLTFKADETPAANTKFNVIILN